MTPPVIEQLEDPRKDQIRQIIALYRCEGWWGEGADDPALVRRLIQGSHFFLIARQGEEIIAMGRAISDRASDAYIQDVTVKEGFRGQGIGTRLVAALEERLAADGIGWVGLIAERNSQRFYQRLGFGTMAGAAPMLKIRSEAP